jgi:hypothetical protein
MVKAHRPSLLVNYDISRLLFPDVIRESSLFNRFWIPRSSRMMTKPEFIGRL